MGRAVERELPETAFWRIQPWSSQRQCLVCANDDGWLWRHVVVHSEERGTRRGKRRGIILLCLVGITHEEGEHEEAPESPEVHFEPLVKLEEVAVTTNEEDETVEFKMYVVWLQDPG